MTTFVTLEQIDQAADALRKRISHRPRVGLILGSGLNSLADSVKEADIIPYSELPNWPISTVQGHAGRLVIGELEGQTVFVMQGRIHFYEGYSMSQITLPVRVMLRLGLEMMFVTNAAGGVHPDFVPGDVMLITDHLNLVGMTGANPLMGPNIDELGPRFPDMSQAYDRELMTLARQVASDENISMREGVYCALSGPSFEGPADLRFLRIAGADAVGMSTVPEVIVARHGGMRVLGFSGISNKANLDGSTATTHEEVIEAGKIITPKMEKIIRGVLSKIPPQVGRALQRRIDMGPVYRTLASYEPLIYIALAIGAMFAFRRMWRAWREWRDSVYGLEREFALRRLGQATAAAFLVLALIFVEFSIATFIVPSLPASDILATPTLDLLLTPAGTLSPLAATQAALSPVTQEVPSGMSGCIPDEIMITSPEPGDEVSGIVDIAGTTNVPNFAFYKYEVARLGTQDWATISAGRESKKNEGLGEWNTSSLTNGDYFLRLVITDNVGASLEPCVIAVRVVNQ